MELSEVQTRAAELEQQSWNSRFLLCLPVPWSRQVVEGIQYQNVEEYLRSLA